MSNNENNRRITIQIHSYKRSWRRISALEKFYLFCLFAFVKLSIRCSCLFSQSRLRLYSQLLVGAWIRLEPLMPWLVLQILLTKLGSAITCKNEINEIRETRVSVYQFFQISLLNLNCCPFSSFQGIQIIATNFFV